MFLSMLSADMLLYGSSNNNNWLKFFNTQYPSRQDVYLNQWINSLSMPSMTRTSHISSRRTRYLYKENHNYVHDLPTRVVGARMSVPSRRVNYARRDAYRLTRIS